MYFVNRVTRKFKYIFLVQKILDNSKVIGDRLIQKWIMQRIDNFKKVWAI